MKTTLIKLLQDKFILVSDEEIKPNEQYINNKVIFYADSKFGEGNNPNNSNPRVTDHNFKIISKNPDFSLLSQEDCKTIGWIDVEMLALEKYSVDTMQRLTTQGFYGTEKSVYGFIEGFNTAKFLNDKMFSLDDIEKAWKAGMEFIGEDKGDYNKLLQSLQQTSWDVEVNQSYQVTKIL